MATPFIGQIIIFGGNFAIRDFAFCNGQILSIAQNTALFSLLGTTYGGNGQTTFALPDLRGRTPIHFGQGAGLSNRVQGEIGGAENVTLTLGQLPEHNHTASASNTASATTTVTLKGMSAAGNTGNPQNAFPANSGRTNIYKSGTPDVDTGAAEAATNVNVDTTVNINNAGGNQAHNNMPPFLALNYLIALQGVYPSRS